MLRCSLIKLPTVDYYRESSIMSGCAAKRDLGVALPRPTGMCGTAFDQILAEPKPSCMADWTESRDQGKNFQHRVNEYQQHVVDFLSITNHRD